VIKDFQTHFSKFLAAIETAGYKWFLNNVVNNLHGGWPLAIGSDEFIADAFDMAEVAGE